MSFPDWPNPDSWMDVAAHFMAAIFMLLVTVIPLRNGKVIKDIKNQVVNGHTSPLRDDLDRAIQAINHLKEDVANFRKAITHDVDSLRMELAHEENRRRDNISEIRSDYDRRIEHLHNRLDDH